MVPELNERDTMYLPLVARFGSLNEAPFKRAVHLLRHRLLRPGVGYADFARLEAVDFSDRSEDLLLGRRPPYLVYVVQTRNLDDARGDRGWLANPSAASDGSWRIAPRPRRRDPDR